MRPPKRAEQVHTHRDRTIWTSFLPLDAIVIFSGTRYPIKTWSVVSTATSFVIRAPGSLYMYRMFTLKVKNTRFIITEPAKEIHCFLNLIMIMSCKKFIKHHCCCCIIIACLVSTIFLLLLFARFFKLIRLFRCFINQFSIDAKPNKLLECHHH